MLKFFQKSLVVAALLLSATGVQAQYGGPRLFLDLPYIYLTAPNVETIGNRMGAGVGAAFNVGTHWSVARVGGGAVFSLDPKAEKVGDSFLTTPYGLLEVGLGKYRSNGNRCAKQNQSAFTLMAVGGLRYDFKAREQRPDAEVKGLEYVVGAELGYFYISDIFKNYDVVLRGNYLTQAEVFSVEFGLKIFLNLRANRD